MSHNHAGTFELRKLSSAHNDVKYRHAIVHKMNATHPRVGGGRDVDKVLCCPVQVSAACRTNKGQPGPKNSYRVHPIAPDAQHKLHCTESIAHRLQFERRTFITVREQHVFWYILMVCMRAAHGGAL